MLSMGNQFPELLTHSPSRGETDLVFHDGSGKLLLTIQHPIIRVAIRDATELLRATLLSNNAFPDPVLAFNFTKHALLSATRNNPNSVNVLRRLEDDGDYLAKLVTLVRHQILRIT